jgi:glycosyltransferase involved in cell wall biosynthesis
LDFSSSKVVVSQNLISSNTKKILIALSSLCAEGTPILVLEMCRWWQQNGIQSFVVTLNPTPRDLEEEFQALEVPIYCLNLSSTGYGRYFQMAREIYRYSKQTQADAFLSMPLGWHTFMAYGAKLAGVKRVATHVGNYPPYWTDNAFGKFRLQIQLGRPVTNQLICCSDYIRQGVIERFGVSSLEATAIYNGVPVETVAQRASAITRNPEQSFTIGMVARLEIHKDQPTLIQAARLLKDRGFQFQVQLIGEGSRRLEYENLIREEKVEDCVSLLGMRRDIPELLGQMDLFVFSAKPDEGFGIALVEAMSAGVPIIATDVGACREVLEEGKLGTLIPPQDPKAMAQAIENFIINPDLRTSTGEQAREKAFNEFTINNMAYQYAHCLQLLS